jgi:hypothetical protein
MQNSEEAAGQDKKEVSTFNKWYYLWGKNSLWKEKQKKREIQILLFIDVVAWHTISSTN